MYEAFYGLRANPFELDPDPAFFFGSKGHQRAHAYLVYGVSQEQGFVVITGEAGAGKTTLVSLLLTELDPRKVVAAQLVSTQLDAENLLRSVAVAFGLPLKPSGTENLLRKIVAYLLGLVRSGRRALLVVDEAQNLTPRALAALSELLNFQLRNRDLLQCFLVGQPELRQLIHAPSMQHLRRRVVASYHLGPLEEFETRAYMEHRLAHVGWTGDPAFDEQAFAPLHRATGGVPRRINSLCERLLLAAFVAQQHLIGPADVEEVVAQLREEPGTDAQASPMLAAQSVPGPASATSELDAMRSYMVSSITARLDRLERNVATLLNLVQRLPGAKAASRPPGGPARVGKGWPPQP
ncbi:MSHA biogenesis protein MshM [Burkholderiales bacterium]|nr:MSHA biogenesis protein MshM [Burkholderiales bacterium]